MTEDWQIRPDASEELSEFEELSSLPLFDTANSVSRRTTGSSGVAPQRSNRRRNQRSRKIRELLQSLPQGVRYVGEASDYNEERIVYLAKRRQQELAQVPAKEIQLRTYHHSQGESLSFLICQFVINIEKVTVKGLI